MVSGLIKGNARGYFLQHGESGLKGYLEKEIENENMTDAEAENLYKEYTGREEKFGRKETVKTSAPKSVEIIKQEKPEVPLPDKRGRAIAGQKGAYLICQLPIDKY